MRRVLGLAMFFLGIGMALVLVLPDTILLWLLAVGALLVGYELFCI